MKRGPPILEKKDFKKKKNLKKNKTQNKYQSISSTPLEGLEKEDQQIQNENE